MKSIFFDLETSDREPIGQILNYSLILVDQDLKPLAECSGEVKISRLQLPVPGAILTNRIEVQKHQAEAQHTEKQAMAVIAEFIDAAIRNSREPVVLVGFNSAKFDIPYLRTSLIRNGLNPYFGGNLGYRDMLLAARKLVMTDQSFPRLPAEKAGAERKDKLSLALENLSLRLGLLDGPQSHHSRDDTLLTLELARTMRDKFSFDPIRYEPYEVRDLHGQTGAICGRAVPNYDLTEPVRHLTTPMALLDSDRKSALWVDLNHYQAGKGRSAINWINIAQSEFVLSPDPVESEELQVIAAKAVEEFAPITLRNFFSEATCDIEQHIYRVDFDGQDALHEAIWKGDARRLNALKARDPQVVYRRYELANYEWGSGDDQRMEEMLRKYANYRYGGNAQLSRAESDKPRLHPTFKKLWGEIESALETAEGRDRELLVALREFYLGSDIYRVAGADLMGTTP